MPLTSEVRVKFSALQTGANDAGTPTFKPVIDKVLALASGTGADQADLLFTDHRIVNASSNDDIDLAGVLVSALGGVITNAELVALLIIADTANVSNLTIGGGSNPFVGFLGGTTPTVGPIRPGGIFLLASPDAAGIGAVVAGTGDILRIANGAGGQAGYTIAILGRSA